MLLLIGVIGLLVTVQRFRLPGVPFFSLITVFNRKEKLTETGSKVYLVFFTVVVLGLLLRFGGGDPVIVPVAKQSVEDTAPAPKLLNAEVLSVSFSTADERPSTAAAQVQAPSVPDATGRYRMVLDQLFVTYMLANDSNAEGFRGNCNELLSTAIGASTDWQSRERQWNALRQCTQLAKVLCSSKSLDACRNFELQSANFQREK